MPRFRNRGTWGAAILVALPSPHLRPTSRGRLTPPGGRSLHPFAPSLIASADGTAVTSPSPVSAPPRRRLLPVPPRGVPPAVLPVAPHRRFRRLAGAPVRARPPAGRTARRARCGRQYTGTSHQTAAGSSAPPGTLNNTTINYYRKIICGRGRMVKEALGGGREGMRGEGGGQQIKNCNCNSCIIVVLLL